ncbi:hypothetical protein [Sorangium sp. So ce1182]|uniref:hypothetical protein n=1 Tax=Sorangium sp. So ce1182 TaxID=3133334 RepID=UPI003F616EDE
MMSNSTFFVLLVLPLVAAGCGTAPGVNAPAEPVPEQVCIEQLAMDQVIDGCGVFVTDPLFGGDDANPGTKDRPVRSIQRGIELARTGRGRVFLTNVSVDEHVTLPSGVDIYGGFQLVDWGRGPGDTTKIVPRYGRGIALIVEPAGAGDTGAADGVSTIDHVSVMYGVHVAMLVRSGAVVEFIQSEIRTSSGLGGRDGERWPGLNQAPDGAHGMYGGDGCSAATVAGGPAVVNPCEGGIPSAGGKGGDGLPDGAGDGEAGEPIPEPNPGHDGQGGPGNRADGGCASGFPGKSGRWGAVGAPGEGIGRITETGWEGDRAAEGSRGMPGQGGGGGGGRRGGLAVCGEASKGGAGGGSGGAGGCGGRGGRGGENGQPSIGIVALHAKLTVRDSVIETSDAGTGGDGGDPEQGGEGGRGAPGGAVGDDGWGCEGGNGGRGGDGGFGGPGRGGDSIGIAYLDEDQLTLEGVTYELGPPGKGGVSWDWSGVEIGGEDGTAVKTLRFPE